MMVLGCVGGNGDDGIGWGSWFVMVIMVFCLEWRRMVMMG